MATLRWKIIEKRNVWFSVSIIVIGLGFGLMAMRGIQGRPLLNLGSDFVGGNTMVVRFDSLNDIFKAKRHDSNALQKESTLFISKVRAVLKGYGLEGSSIQISDDQDVIIKTTAVSEDMSARVRASLQENLGRIEILEIDYVGPTMGAELRTQSLIIILVVTIALLAYISWRFELAYGVAAVGATTHDALVLVSAASILGIEVNTAFVAALLTILGYSINDTIVIFDRIRERIGGASNIQETELAPVLNTAIQETIWRTINTVLTVIVVLVSLLIFGGATIRSFCVVLLIGTIAGTYSSIFIASPIMAIVYRRIRN